jgi:DNA polymerase I-like protein with 3'-5' exonuclease and polymerase domains
VQGGAADQTKLALVLLYKMCKEKGLEYPVVLVAHDEIVAEFPTKDANEGKKLVDTAMIQAGEQLFPDAPWKVDAKLGQNWGIKNE